MSYYEMLKEAKKDKEENIGRAGRVLLRTGGAAGGGYAGLKGTGKLLKLLGAYKKPGGMGKLTRGGVKASGALVGAMAAHKGMKKLIRKINEE